MISCADIGGSGHVALGNHDDGTSSKSCSRCQYHLQVQDGAIKMIPGVLGPRNSAPGDIEVPAGIDLRNSVD
eukprot:2154925-Rhodomonas_salina.1